MREAIEHVIEELESAGRYAKSIDSNRGRGMWQAYGVAVHKLKAVLAEHGTNDSGTVPESTQTKAE